MARKKKKESALDLVDQLLSNEKPAAPKKRGRPKGSKNKVKKKVVKKRKSRAKKEAPELEIVEQLISNEDKPTKKGKSSYKRPQFVTPTEYEELGSPKFGYTTTRTMQWKNKTAGYWEVYLEYQRCAILWSKLAKTMDWYTSTDESHLKLCRKEIAAFKEAHGLTKGDFGEVLQISHNAQHKRKVLLKKLKEVAKLVLEDRKAAAETPEEAKKINFREVIKIPPNIRPVLQFVTLDLSSIEDDVRGAIADLTSNPQVISEHACPDHINYKGLRKNRNGCPTCLYFYRYNKENKVKEKRNR